MSNQPIGIFDSGIGGLSTLRALHHQLPQEHFIYVADLAHAPYGNKSDALLRERSDAISAFLLARRCKAIVIACNTATAAAIASLRERHSVPFIGVEPGIKPAIHQSPSGIVAILATERTLASAKFAGLLQQFSNSARIITQACPGLAEAIEGGAASRDARLTLLQRYITPVLQRGADTLVLGCTHYPLITEEIRQFSANAGLIDTSEAIARQVVRQLADNGLINDGQQRGDTRFHASLPPRRSAETLSDVFSYYWDERVTVKVLPDAATGAFSDPAETTCPDPPGSGTPR